MNVGRTVWRNSRVYGTPIADFVSIPQTQQNLDAVSHENRLLQMQCRSAQFSTLALVLKCGMVIWTTTIRKTHSGFPHPASVETGVLRITPRLMVTVETRLFHVGTLCAPKMSQGLDRQR